MENDLRTDTFYSQQKNCTPHEDWRNLLKSENSSTFTIMFTSPRIPCIVSNTGIQPDITDPVQRNYCKTVIKNEAIKTFEFLDVMHVSWNLKQASRLQSSRSQKALICTVTATRTTTKQFQTRTQNMHTNSSIHTVPQFSNCIFMHVCKITKRNY